MQVIIVHANEFRLSPETESEREVLRSAQKSAEKTHSRMAYAGRSESDDKHLRFNVGGTVRLSANRHGERWHPPKYKSEGGTTIEIRPRGANADEAFNILKFHGICSSTILVEGFAGGLL